MRADNSGGDINQTCAELNVEVCMFTPTHPHTQSLNKHFYMYKDCTNTHTSAPEKLWVGCERSFGVKITRISTILIFI